MAAGETEAARWTRSVPPSGEDPRLVALRGAVLRLRRDLRAFPGATLADREIAERELAALDAMSASGRTDDATLQQGLLLIAAAVGSVSALAPAVVQLRDAVELFGVLRYRIPPGRL